MLLKCLFPQVSANKGPTQLSSAYNYAGGRAQRQQTQIMVPEGPQLTAEQLEIVESQFKVGVWGLGAVVWLLVFWE